MREAGDPAFRIAARQIGRGAILLWRDAAEAVWFGASGDPEAFRLPEGLTRSGQDSGMQGAESLGIPSGR